jgi:hypothetical protein
MDRDSIYIIIVAIGVFGTGFLCGMQYGPMIQEKRKVEQTEAYAKDVMEGLDSAMIKLREVNDLVNSLRARDDSISAILNEAINQ